MTVPATHYRKMPCPDERRPGFPVDSCVAATGVQMARAATNGAISASDAEVVALRAATGDIHGPENLPDLQSGIRSRYGFSTTLDDQWDTIAAGLAADKWFAVLGWYFDLPDRLRNAGQKNVMHCIPAGPDTQNHCVIADPLQKPVVTYEWMTLAELRTFCAGGSFQSLAIREYSHIPPAAEHRVLISAKATVRQAVMRGTCIQSWEDRRWGRTASTAPCSEPRVMQICSGGTATVVYVTKGTFKNRWIHLGSGVALVPED